MGKIILQGYIIVSDTDLLTIKSELLIHEKLTRQESGCLIFQVIQDHINPNQFNVYEEFSDQEAFENHQLRVKNSNWGKVTINVERYIKSRKYNKCITSCLKMDLPKLDFWFEFSSFSEL